jgi:hypothetical protein
MYPSTHFRPLFYRCYRCRRLYSCGATPVPATSRTTSPAPTAAYLNRSLAHPSRLAFRSLQRRTLSILFNSESSNKMSSLYEDDTPDSIKNSKGLHLVTQSTPNGQKVQIMLEELKQVYGTVDWDTTLIVCRTTPTDVYPMTNGQHRAS